MSTNTTNLATQDTQQPADLNSSATSDKNFGSAKKVDISDEIIQKKLKQNKLFFYGFPLVVVVCVFISLLFFVIPGIRFYFIAHKYLNTLDDNVRIVEKSVANLRAALNDESALNEADSALSSYIPFDAKAGNIINIIQTKAKDFNLESKVSVPQGASNTSLGSIATKDGKTNNIFNSISSSETLFKPKELGGDIEAVLISTEVNLKGNKQSFLSFLNELKKVKPLINLVFIDYNEGSSADTANVNATLRLESYALKESITDLKPASPKQYKNDDSSLYDSEFREERFIWDKSLVNTLNSSNSSGNTQGN